MKTFNPEKELKKIQKGNKNKVIFSIMTLLLIIAIGSSYALYQIRYSKQIIYTTVQPFYSKDIQISLYVDGEKDTTSETFPTKESGKIFSHITCENGSSGVFDNTKWELSLKIKQQDKCNVYFVTGNLPNAPELYQGMIPVIYDEEGNIYVADTESDWYNYQDHRWGNAVLVDNTKEGVTEKYFNGTELKEDIVGTKIPMEEILQMYVWIPRYKYKLFNVGDKTTASKQIIEIAFEKGIESTGDVTCTTAANGKESCINAENGNWYTHPAFTFGNTDLKGFWVGKFEPSDPTYPNGRTNNKIDEIIILPNKTSMVNMSVSTAFFAEQKLKNVENKYNLASNEVDTRMMKNIEWGAVAYLMQSVYGIYKDEKTCNIKGMEFNACEVWINNSAQGAGLDSSNAIYQYGGTYTGCVGNSISVGTKWNTDDNTPAKCAEGNRWNEKGVNASTTGNMYGIYDMSGGAWEYMMALITTDGGTDLYYNSEASGFTKDNMPASKYYDTYEFSDSDFTHERGHLGDATKETLIKFGIDSGGWNADMSRFPYVVSGSTRPWFQRGTSYTGVAGAGVFAFYRVQGSTFPDSSFRSVLSAA